MINKVSDPHFIVFSDEPQWAKENLKLEFPLTIVDYNRGDRNDEVRLTSQCKHQIIANRSFNGWAARLNDHAQKSVVAPLKWFNNVSVDARDLMLTSWSRF